MTILVERFLRRVSRHSTIEEQNTVGSILTTDLSTPRRSVMSGLPSPEDMPMTELKVESEDFLTSKKQTRVCNNLATDHF